MKAGIAGIVGVVVVAAAAGGYYFGARQAPAPVASSAPAAGQGGEAKKERKLLYYRNPMGLPDTSPVPKKDQMGMDYIAVYEGEEPASSGSELKISTERLQKLGVRTQPAERRALDRIVRAAGRVEVDERLLATISPKFEGYVERLHVNTTGEHVAKGQALFEAYSPELVAAQREYAIAARGVGALKDATAEGRSGMSQLAESSLTRLRNWDVSNEQIEALARTGEAQRTVTFRSPATGIVMEKKAVSGMRFMPGEALYQVADLSRVWVLADVNEQDIGHVANGRMAQVRINAYPGRRFEGVVTYIYPTLKMETRTVAVRLELANPGGLLKPGMYAEVELASGAATKVVAVPVSAVIDSGVRRVVIVQVGEGRFEPRTVELGGRSDEWVEVRSGVQEGESVVVAANFLIDAESNLRAALGGMAGAPKPDGDAKPPVTHRAEGTLDAVDARAGSVTVTHQPVASLKWPGMTMEFALANASLVAGVKPGAAIDFEFVERKPGEWVITAVKPATGAAKGAVKPADPPKGR
ncbi:MAG: efflux RND transporter periplasmic adaptor subunit [Betaproteobacteria bacterium]|nr:efflux RND transporter periplasmic adaptor subunit [Betaproteobacteria bacterium]